ncbi:hypothetical protein AB0F03_19950 [Streptomyces sp. NPDC028722]|uniref:hypothetical protein n=1 Tax=Streptomyces sp. NPDC028722 TaxID=3155016 RepID=UPI003403E218
MAAAAPALAGADRVRLDDRVAEAAVLGTGLRPAPAMTAAFCAAQARAGACLAATSFDSRRLGAFCPQAELGSAVRALCEIFATGVLGTGAPAEPRRLPTLG